MARRTLVNIDEKILQLTIEYGAKDINKVSVVSIAKELGITDPTIFVHFKTKTNLLYQAYMKINKEFIGKLKVYDLNEASERRRAWLDMFDYLLINPDYTLYYYNYEHSAYYTAPTQYISEEIFTTIGKANLTENSSRQQHLALWIHVIDSTFAFAIKVFQGVLPNTVKTKETIFDLIMSGIEQ